jgi:hypothetical protein
MTDFWHRVFRTTPRRSAPQSQSAAATEQGAEAAEDSRTAELKHLTVFVYKDGDVVVQDDDRQSPETVRL